MTPDYNTGEVPYTNQSNYNQRKRPERPLDPVSITVPGEAMTIQEIMERALGGMPIERENYGYFDQEDIDKISKFYAPHNLDLTDLDELRNEVAEFQAAVDNAIENRDNPEPEPEPIPEPEPTPDTDPTP